MAIRQSGGSSSSGNVRLKALRHANGWVSQQQLADAFEKKALECGLRLAVSVRQVRRWESADPPWPTPDYQKVLQELFGCPLTDLGFIPPWQADLDAATDDLHGFGGPGGGVHGGVHGGANSGNGGNGQTPPGGYDAYGPAGYDQAPPALGHDQHPYPHPHPYADPRSPDPRYAQPPGPGPSPASASGSAPLGGAVDTPRLGPPRPGGFRVGRHRDGTERRIPEGRMPDGRTPDARAPDGLVLPRAVPPPGPADTAASLAAGLMPEPVRQVQPRFDESTPGMPAPRLSGGRFVPGSRRAARQPAERPQRLGGPLAPITGTTGAAGLPSPASPTNATSATSATPAIPATPSGLILPGRPAVSAPGAHSVERLSGIPDLLSVVSRIEVADPRDIEAVVPGPAHSGRLGSPMADQYARLTASYRQMYWVAPAQMTLQPVESHVHLGTTLLDAPGPSRPRRVLAASVAETAMLAGRIAFFDLGDKKRALQYYSLAEQAATEAGEPLLRHAVLGHVAFVPAWAGRAGDARAMIARANNPAALHAAGAPALMRAWLCAVNAEIESLIGDKDLALHYIDRAEDILCHPDDLEVPAWLDFFDSARLWGFRGAAELEAGRFDAARDALTDALGDLPPSAAKQQAVTCADLARVAAMSGDIDEASGMLSRALDALTRQWYRTAMTRVWDVRTQLEPFKNAHCIRRLDQELEAWRGENGSAALGGDERDALE